MQEGNFVILINYAGHVWTSVSRLMGMVDDASDCCIRQRLSDTDNTGFIYPLYMI